MNTDATLATLDPATTPADLDVRHVERAQALLARITATEPADTVVLLRPRGPVVRRVVAAGGAVAAAVVLTVAVPDLVGSDDAAYAAWSPVPAAVSAEQAEAAADACLDGGPFGWLPGRQGPDLDALVTEARGSWTMAYFSDPSGMNEQVCLLRGDELVGTHGQAAGPGAQAVEVAADGAHGSIGGVLSTEDESLRSSTGLVGDDVVGLVLHTEAQGDVTATIANGHYAAWWPDAPVTEQSESADTTPSFSGATLTLRDGTTREIGVDELTGLPMESLTTPDEGGSASAG
ncbi:hypothetical protein DDE18_20090 [Nocardioides gansuensis]|uniref:Uncharacterized protein n=1 Tax=Nocardioides gansuensis TaxID=2138300 RepID=A0A2T8F5X0_9ACTN|nr:hypothetical protein [Nocardioides gansuensis]PVG81110.1 hypothetical protein DDE18_20090 [Nocardioides gansuensis]